MKSLEDISLNDLKEFSKSFSNDLKRGVIPRKISKISLATELKYNLTPREADRILNQLDDELYNYVESYPLAESYKQIGKGQSYFQDNNLIKEINWISSFLIDYADEINSFLEFEKEYDNHLLLGNYEEALRSLNKIESKISVSSWSIQQKLVIAELDKGFSHNKDVLSSILSTENSNTINFLSNYTSIRIERNISPSQFDSIVKELHKISSEPKLSEYIQFKIDFFSNFKYNHFDIILALDGQLSIIDRYKTFISFLQIYYYQINRDKKVESLLKRTIIDLAKRIQDIDLHLLEVKIGSKVQLDINDRFFVEISDLYTLGEYSLLKEKCETFLLKDPKCFPVILTYCKTITYLNCTPKRFNLNHSLLDRIIKVVLEFLLKTETFTEESFLEAYKIVHFLGNHHLSIGLLHFLAQEVPYIISPIKDIKYYDFYLLSSRALSPSLHSLIEPKYLNNFLALFENESVKSSTTNLVNTLYKSSQFLISNLNKFNLTELKVIAITLTNKNEYNFALKVYDYVLFNNHLFSDLKVKHVYLDFVIGKYYCLIKNKSYGEALKLSCDILIKEPNTSHKFFSPPFLNVLKESEDYELQSNIYLSIYLKIYESHMDSYHVYVAYDNYLESVSCKTPSEYIKTLQGTLTIEDTAFLDLVCKHETLHSSPEFNDHEELDLERIEICNFLTNNSDRREKYDSEISDLLRKVLVRKGIKQIDYSKIYVDIKGLKSTLQKDLKESFYRNLEIASLPLDQLKKIVSSLGNILVYYYDKDSSDVEYDSEDIREKLRLTSYNRFLHFKEAFIKIRDKFILSSDHGLDTYLSMRIRHGTLLGQIRSVFENHNLITVWSDQDNEYLPNSYWISKLQFLLVSNQHKLNSAFNAFSKSIDRLGDNLKSQIIQIKTEVKQTSGLFDYSYDDIELLTLFQQRFGSIKDFDEFVEEVIQVLWDKTEDCLNNIKIYLNDEFINYLNQEFDALEKVINTIQNESQSNNELPELVQTVRNCKTAIAVEIGKISEWFNRSNKKLIEEFDFTILLDSSINTLQSVNPLFKDAKINYDIKCDLIFDGDLFPYFTDMLFYLLDNAIKHSRLESKSLYILISIKQDDNIVRIVIENNVFNEKSYLDYLDNHIHKTREKIYNAKFHEHINKEGGTGFIKIKKTLTQDLNRKDNDIQIHLLKNEDGSENIFKTEIKFNINDLYKNIA